MWKLVGQLFIFYYASLIKDLNLLLLNDIDLRFTPMAISQPSTSKHTLFSILTFKSEFCVLIDEQKHVKYIEYNYLYTSLYLYTLLILYTYQGERTGIYKINRI